MKKSVLLILALVLACALFAGHAFTDERKDKKIKPYATAMKGKADDFEVRLIFDENGELADVRPAEGAKDYDREQIDTLDKKNFYSSTTVLYGHGSPGYTVYKTRDGYIIISKPQ